MTEFADIYETYFADVELYLRAICRDEALAEELTEQVFFRALKALPTFRGDCDIRTWPPWHAMHLCPISEKKNRHRASRSFKSRIREKQWKNGSWIRSRPWPSIGFYMICRNRTRRYSRCESSGSFRLGT